MIKISIPIFDGVDELDAIGSFEVFQNAARFGAELACELVAADPAQPVTASHGLKMFASGSLDAPCDWLVVPGGNWARPELIGVRTQIQSGELPRMIASLYAEKRSIASVCTGAMLLSAAGVLKGRSATTHRVAKSALEQEGAILIEARVVDDGDIVTAGGVTSGIDLALYLISRWFGSEISVRVQVLMEYHPSGEVWRLGVRAPL